MEKDFEYIGKTVGEMLSQEDTPFEVVTLFREGKIPENYSQLTKIKENDVILLRGPAEEIARFDRKGPTTNYKQLMESGISAKIKFGNSASLPLCLCIAIKFHQCEKSFQNIKASKMIIEIGTPRSQSIINFIYPPLG